MTEQDIMRQMLEGFLNDPPDTEYQRGFLAALLTISNEVAGIPVTDPVWSEADRLITNFPRTPWEKAHEKQQREMAKKKVNLTIVKGDKE